MSVLTVNVNQVSDGILIRCLNVPLDGDSVEIGNATIIKTGDTIKLINPQHELKLSCMGGKIWYGKVYMLDIIEGVL